MIEGNIYTSLSLMGIHKVKRASNDNLMCQCVLSSQHEKGDRKPSMSVKINPNGVSPVFCFGCGYRGTIVGLAYELEKTWGGDLVRQVRGLEYGGVYKPMFKAYEDVMHLRHRNDIADRHLAKRDKLPEINIKEYDDCLGFVPKYMIEKRGICIDTLRAWRIGHWKRGRQGVFFPIFDSDKKMVGYSIRWIFPKEDEPSYFHMPGLNKKKILYGENMIDKVRSNIFVIVEGAIDALKVWTAGYNALSTLGGDFSDNQASKIITLCEGMEGIAMGDGDKGGKKLADGIMDKLSDRCVKIRRIVLDEARDPGDMTTEEIRAKIEGR
ncbi:MAG: toprim domain-containing protein [Nitrospirae bacterium]|nr:toprim domain-containing protein [Nitrospirota bacterium]